MKGINIVKHVLVGTIWSILIFLSISFLTVLSQINPFFTFETEDYILEIGFPFVYNVQFCVSGNEYPNTGWTMNNLFYDCLLTWLFVNGIYLLIMRNKFRTNAIR
jgi:hypothetical protein